MEDSAWLTWESLKLQGSSEIYDLTLHERSWIARFTFDSSVRSIAGARLSVFQSCQTALNEVDADSKSRVRDL